MNPFRYGKIVKDEFFYDRKDDVKRIKDILCGGNNIVLYAPRRFGKSSLVSKVFDQLDADGYKTVWIDFMSVYSQETFIEQYTKAIASSQQKHIVDFMKKISSFLKGIALNMQFDEQSFPVFSVGFNESKISQSTLEEVIDLPDKLATKEQKYIIAFDEFQEINKLNGENFEKLLSNR